MRIESKHFQFSFWDSRKLKKLLLLTPYATFNSLFEIHYKQGRTWAGKTKTPFNSLFEIPWSWSYCTNALRYFQFSFWDSLLGFSKETWRRGSMLSILFLRFGETGSQTQEGGHTLSILFLRFIDENKTPFTYKLIQNFQFSFWDSISITYMCIWPQFFQFSFWDSLKLLLHVQPKVHPLSILFLRFKADPNQD